MYYATLAQLRAETETNQSVPANPSALVAADYNFISLLNAASRLIESRTHRHFYPYVRANYFDSVGDHIDEVRGLLSVLVGTQRDPVLSISRIDNVTTPNPETLSQVSSTQYALYPLEDEPHTTIQFYTASTALAVWGYLFPLGTQWQQSIKVTGTWGYRTAYAADAWISSGTSVQNVGGVNSSATSITVATVNDADGRGLVPRFSVGNLIRATVNGSTEYMDVIGVTVGTNTLTVRRGVYGTTAIALPQSTALDVFVPEPEINRACLRIAGYMAARRTAYNRRQLNDFGTVTDYAPDIPDDAVAILDYFADKGSAAV